MCPLLLTTNILGGYAAQLLLLKLQNDLQHVDCDVVVAAGR